MSIAEFEPATLGKIEAPADATPEMLVNMVAIPDHEMFQAYLVMRFGEAVLRLSEADQAELYQMDVSGATEQAPILEPLDTNWDILRGLYDGLTD